MVERANGLERDSIMFGLSERFKDAIGEFAEKNSLSISALIREAVAEKIGYDLGADRVARGRPKKYRNESERKIATKRRSAEKRALVKALLQAHKRAEQEAAAAALRESLVRKGVDPDS